MSFCYFILGHNIDIKSLRNRNNGNNTSTTGTLMSEKQKLSSNHYKYYSDISDISNGILGTIPEKVIFLFCNSMALSNSRTYLL